MAFGIKRTDLENWKQKAADGEIAIMTHFWYDRRFPEANTVTKVACSDDEKLMKWGKKYGLKPEWIHHRSHYSHFDLLLEKQEEVLTNEGLLWQLERLCSKT